MVYIGGLSVAQGMVTAGAWYLFLLSLDRFLFPVMSLSSFWTSGPDRAFGRRARVRPDRRRPGGETDGAPAVPRLKGEIDFEHVNFHYKEKEPVLEDFNLHIAPARPWRWLGTPARGNRRSPS